MSQQHVTTQILQAVADRLSAVVGVAGVQAVRVSRVWPTDVRDLPAICVYAPDETISRRHGQPGRRIERRSIRVQVVAVLPRPAGADNTLEADVGLLKTAIEEVLGADPTLVSGDPALPLATDLHLTAAGSGLDPSTGLTLVLAWLTYSAIVHHPEGSPTTPLTRLQS